MENNADQISTPTKLKVPEEVQNTARGYLFIVINRHNIMAACVLDRNELSDRGHGMDRRENRKTIGDVQVEL